MRASFELDRAGDSSVAGDGDATVTDAVAATVTDAAAPIIVGKIAGQHGVKGWLKVQSFTRPPGQILQYRRWLIAGRDGDWREFEVAAAREQMPKLRAKLAGIDDRDAAEALAGRLVSIAESQLEKLPAGEYYWSDLIGLTVVNRAGVALGAVDHLIETGANDVLVVRDGEMERLLPWTPHAIVEVDTAAGILRVDWEAEWDAPPRPARAVAAAATVATAD